MKKLKFTVQVIVLLLAFPTWFYAEMKQADKAIQNSKQNSMDTIKVQKAETVLDEAELPELKITGMPFSSHMVVSN